MTPQQEQDTLAMARRVLAEGGASNLRRQWADDAIRALEHGDVKAARRIGMCPDSARAHLPTAKGAQA